MKVNHVLLALFLLGATMHSNMTFASNNVNNYPAGCGYQASRYNRADAAYVCLTLEIQAYRARGEEPPERKVLLQGRWQVERLYWAEKLSECIEREEQQQEPDCPNDNHLRDLK